jgi:hypothetical protein
VVVIGLGGGGPNTPVTGVLATIVREGGTEATRLLGGAERPVVLCLEGGMGVERNDRAKDEGMGR